MPRSALAAYPERLLPHAYLATRSHKDYLSVVPLTVRTCKFNKAISQGGCNSLVLGLAVVGVLLGLAARSIHEAERDE